MKHAMTLFGWTHCEKERFASIWVREGAKPKEHFGMKTTTVPTRPFADQRPGTSGLRKRIETVRQPHYLQNFLQSIFDAVDDGDRNTLVIGGDGRFYNKEAVQTAIRMAGANGYRHLIVGRSGLLSTPAVSNLIRKTGAGGGLIFSASHNPGGPEGDFGIKYNSANGGPAPSDLTEAIYVRSRQISAYCIVEMADVALDRLGTTRLDGMSVDVIDPVADYARLMETLFDFDQLSALLQSVGFRMRFDAMHVVTGPYAKAILEDRLGAPADTVVNGVPLPDFGGQSPDPNLMRARAFVDGMFAHNAPAFGGASDGDGDRNMILGRKFFVTPSDSLAVLAANASLAPGCREGLRGLARSMPTSRAVDQVAQEMGIPCYETPTGWKYFGNLLDDGRITICGEESFGTGSDHVREKDGLWAVLLWLTVLAERRIPVARIVRDHWRTYGRHFYSRHDYEGLDVDQAAALMEALSSRADRILGQRFGRSRISTADDFSYADPVDHSVTMHQGVRLILADGARVVYRLSGTGSSAATLRLYLERYEPNERRHDQDAQAALAELAATARDFAGVASRLGRHAPDIVT
jgi:phosphoglucomutase